MLISIFWIFFTTGTRYKMKTARTKILSLGIFSLLFGIFLINTLAAQTLIAGKIYNEGYSGIVSGADVLVTCNSASLNTNSLEDGTYAVRFDIGACTLGDSVKVAANKSGLSGQASGNVGDCDGQPCTDSNYLAVLNLMIKASALNSPFSGGNSGGGGYYLCGNGICNSGENERTCPQDCKPKTNVTNTTTAQTTSSTTSATGSTSENETNVEINSTAEEQEKVSSGITGAIVGTLGTAGTLGVLIFIIAVILLSLVVYIKRKKARALYY